ncbi:MULTISPECIES: anti-sigma factor [Pseudomonas]|jgi:anti-sigma-K factor RskA|uniref:anti-sigma factor n=1 Tax=Pseudomonas TaxID=286 RepID=UPI00099DE6F4|nr:MULTISPECIES: anti-sigma factor [Pseudomonas]MCK3827726.1 RNA polymerase subunit sigma-70 [Pseudomonas sp. W2Aug9]MCK3836572.1 RNA polymerase subunit sigma-70 [Pseudomonas sp. NCIMB 10586]MCK3845452.1 RNA polymerase subunit sigma-70 [Pseudomonas sp. W15Feb34]MCK3863912.1 RNA polymerase subunit sigma-70 [Pseudomonas sp. B329]OPB03144.1 RNA polymerase subunit sigma-70 [Pseudomonas synxantha]
MSNPLDELASEYVLGTLPANQRAEVEQRLKHDSELRAAVDAWEQRLLPLTALAEPVPPSAQLWRRIEHSTANQDAGVPWWNLLSLWRGLAGAGLVTTLVLAALLLTRPPVADSTFVVVLVAPQSQTPGWVIQASHDQQIQLIPLGVMEVPNDKALQFWTKGDGWQAPVSLGLVKPGQTLSVPLDKLPPLAPNQLFELTLEDPRGSPTGKPTGPIQAIGRAVKVL